MSNVRYQTVDNRHARGIIVTSETLMDLHRNIRDMQREYVSEEALSGARHIVEFLENCYNKNFYR